VLSVWMVRIGCGGVGSLWTQLRSSTSQPNAVLDLQPGGTLVKQLRGLDGAFLWISGGVLNHVEDLHQHLRILLHVVDDLIPLILRDGRRSYVHGLCTIWLDSGDLSLVEYGGFFAGSYPWGMGVLSFLLCLSGGRGDFRAVVIVERA